MASAKPQEDAANVVVAVSRSSSEGCQNAPGNSIADRIDTVRVCSREGCVWGCVLESDCGLPSGFGALKAGTPREPKIFYAPLRATSSSERGKRVTCHAEKGTVPRPVMSDEVFHIASTLLDAASLFNDPHPTLRWSGNPLQNIHFLRDCIRNPRSEPVRVTSYLIHAQPEHYTGQLQGHV